VRGLIVNRQQAADLLVLLQGCLRSIGTVLSTVSLIQKQCFARLATLASKDA
jgi:hypothetical protein